MDSDPFCPAAAETFSSGRISPLKEMETLGKQIDWTRYENIKSRTSTLTDSSIQQTSIKILANMCSAQQQSIQSRKRQILIEPLEQNLVRQSCARSYAPLHAPVFTSTAYLNIAPKYQSNGTLKRV